MLTAIETSQEALSIDGKSSIFQRDGIAVKIIINLFPSDGDEVLSTEEILKKIRRELDAAIQPWRERHSAPSSSA